MELLVVPALVAGVFLARRRRHRRRVVTGLPKEAPAVIVTGGRLPGYAPVRSRRWR